jgi:hypothetical protein
VPEGLNIELAHKLTEKEEHAAGKKRRWEEVVEILEAVFLAIVAVSTAWSGFQAAKWDGQQSLLYGEASKYRFEADAASARGETIQAADASMLTAWLQFKSEGNQKLADLYVRRFSPDYRAAFFEWIKLDPLNDTSAPPGPAFMPDYRNPDVEEGKRLNAKASIIFDGGSHARETAEKYVRYTVLFASVLFLIAVAQRFKIRGVRFATLGIAFALLAYAVSGVVALPRL